MENQQPRRSTRRWVVIALAALILSLPIAVFGVAVSSNIYFLEESITETEDVYVAANSARIFGTIEGDLLVAAGDVTIAGDVTGDVIVATQGAVTVSGEVGGSLRGLARDVAVTGTVADDVAVAAVTIDIPGVVGRDVLLLAASLDVDGQVGRDILGRVQSATLDGGVGGDVDVLISSLTLGSNVAVAGDVIYRSDADATVSSESEVAGSLSKLPTTGSFIVRSVLLFVTLIHFLSFVFAGLLLLWLFQPTMASSVEAVVERPWQSIGIGLLAFVVLPVVIVLLVFSLVGIPVGILLLLLLLLSFFFAPIPAVTAVGHRLLSGRGALFGGFILGAMVWRGAIWLIPWIGLVLYGVSAAAGLGGFLLATYDRRRRDTAELPLVAVVARSSPDDALTETVDHGDWEPPLAPSKAADREENDETHDAGTDDEVTEVEE